MTPFASPQLRSRKRTIESFQRSRSISKRSPSSSPWLAKARSNRVCERPSASRSSTAARSLAERGAPSAGIASTAPTSWALGPSST
ncbi:MAG: hypothetical protein CL471_09540 [Acidobacteria bacterium]|nr:hypothetical protein [Acidobacteriota bacterium]